jgi:hypothetical protein
LSTTDPAAGETAVALGELFEVLGGEEALLVAEGMAVIPGPELTGPVGTASFTWLQTVVDVVVGAVLEGGVLVIVYEKSKLPLSVVALRADSTWCSAGPLPMRGWLPGR